jgi:hypothetical protein
MSEVAEPYRHFSGILAKIPSVVLANEAKHIATLGPEGAGGSYDAD